MFTKVLLKTSMFDLKCNISTIPLGIIIIVPVEVLVIYNIAEFLTNFMFSIIIISTFLSDIFTITNPDISSMEDTFILINLCSLGLNIIYSFRKHGVNLFKELKHDYLEMSIPSTSNIYFIPRTKSTFSCIPETAIDISKFDRVYLLLLIL